MTTRSTAVLIGSLRRGSHARQIAHHVLEFFPAGHEARIVRIDDLPLYNFDYDDPAVPDVPTPEPYTRFREDIRASDGVLFVTPENNRTIPAVLKNAVDVGSKPNDGVVWTGLPAGIISHSVGRMGGYSSQKNLRLALSYFSMPMPAQPEVFLGQSPTLLDADGRITPPRTLQFIRDYIHRHCELIDAQPR